MAWRGGQCVEFRMAWRSPLEGLEMLHRSHETVGASLALRDYSLGCA